MVKHFNKWDTLRSFIDKDLVDKILVLVGEPWFKSDLASHDLVTNLPWMDTCEGSSSMDQLVEQNA